MGDTSFSCYAGIYIMKKSLLYTIPMILVVLICIQDAKCCLGKPTLPKDDIDDITGGIGDIVSGIGDIVGGATGREAVSSIVHLEELEVVAFDVCNTDGTEGLTWAEIEECEATFCDLLPIGCPTKDDFERFDFNKDGILTLTEWKLVTLTEEINTM